MSEGTFFVAVKSIKILKHACEKYTKKEVKQMIITLKDGSTKEYSEPKSIIEIAADISEGLARMACAGEVNGE